MATRQIAVLDGSVVELLDRGVERGFVLLSEIEDLRDPLTHADSFVDDVSDRAREVNIQVIDDLTDTEGAAETVHVLGLSADPVRQYLNEVGRHDLLTAEDEVNLAKRYRAGLAAREILRSGMKLPPKKKAMLAWIRRDGSAAKEHMVKANLRLVVSQARAFTRRGVDMLELVQEGNLGLIRGVEKFDHTKGYKFSTYAVWWIRQALQRGVANKARTIRLPVHVWETASKMRGTEFDLRKELGRDPTDAEIAAAMDLSVERIREVREATRDLASLDKAVGEDGDATMGDLIADADAIDPSNSAAAMDARSQVERALECLNERERTILLLRFGLTGGEPLTLEEVGEQFGLTRERIRQIEKRTLAKLRHPSRAQALAGLLDALEAA